MSENRLLARLKNGVVIVGEGYVFELERRGYVQAGPFVPDVVLDDPGAVKELHKEFARAGSDVIEALTYYLHREKLRIIGKEDLLEPLNRRALELATEVANEYGCLVAGNVSNTNIWHQNLSPEREAEIRAMFASCVSWAKDAKVDYIIAETFDSVGEAMIALEEIKAAGMVAVVTLAIMTKGTTQEGYTAAEACVKLEQAGADVVGLNCARGPDTMLPLLEEIVKVVKIPVAAMPVTFCTTEKEPNFQTLTFKPTPDSEPVRCFPDQFESKTCTRHQMAEFAKKAAAIGVKYIGVCCGGSPHHIRSMAEALGRTPPASQKSADMSKHVHFGNNPNLDKSYQTQLLADFAIAKQ